MEKVNRGSFLAVSGLCFYVLLLVCFVGLLAERGAFIVEWSLSTAGVFDFQMPFVFDVVSLCFSFVVVVVSGCVLAYSASYMDSEANFSRFVWLVMLFVGFMNLVVFVPSVLGIMLGWDGLGLVSFLLVVFYQSRGSLGAGLVTVFMGRVGDVFLFLSVVLLSVGGQWYFWSVGSFAYVDLVVLFIILTSITKSAQMPFSYWLPMAMKAPTPVSALVHSSTLVTAGVYFLFRFLPTVGVEGVFPVNFLMGVSLFTAFMSGFSACFESDLKKVVALSTLSQLGIMVFSLSLGWYALGFFHLLSHALFKALMFVSVGRVIHCCGGFQEMRDGGGLWVKMPLTTGCLMLASMSMVGIPFMSGFYSKDLMVESFLSGRFSLVVGVCVMLALASTVFYIVRFFMSSVWGKVNSGSIQVVEGMDLCEIIPVVILCVGAVMGGFVLQLCLFPTVSLVIVEGMFKFFLSLVLCVSVLLGFLYSLVKLSMESLLLKAMSSFFVQMWFSSFLISGFNSFSLKCGFVAKEVDLGWNEHVLGGLGVFNVVLSMSSKALSYHNMLIYFWEARGRSVSSCFLMSFFVMAVVILVVSF